MPHGTSCSVLPGIAWGLIFELFAIWRLSEKRRKTYPKTYEQNSMTSRGEKWLAYGMF